MSAKGLALGLFYGLILWVLIILLIAWVIP